MIHKYELIISAVGVCPVAFVDPTEKSENDFNTFITKRFKEVNLIKSVVSKNSLPSNVLAEIAEKGWSCTKN